MRPRSAEISASKANVQPSSHGIEVVGQPSPPSAKVTVKRKVTKTKEDGKAPSSTKRMKVPKIDPSINTIDVTNDNLSQSSELKPKDSLKAQSKTSRSKRTVRESSVHSTASNDESRPRKRSRKSVKYEQPAPIEHKDEEMKALEEVSSNNINFTKS